MLGEKVTVTVNHPLGSKHPEYGYLYPVNFGYVNNLLAEDNDFQDAYIVGVENPVSSFTGIVIAIITRVEDYESKWVVAPEDCRLCEAELRVMLNFQEKYFTTSYDCLYEKSYGGAVYKIIDNVRRYLIIKNIDLRSGHWGMPKGHMETGETGVATATREIKEETNINVTLDPRFSAETDYMVKKGVKKISIYFPAKATSNDVNLQCEEVDNHEWLRYEDAVERITHKGDKNVLIKIENYLKHC